MQSKRPASVVIDSAMYLLTMGSLDIDNVAMSLYDIKIWIIILDFRRGNSVETSQHYERGLRGRQGTVSISVEFPT